jgi:hypothetical protein
MFKDFRDLDAILPERVIAVVDRKTGTVYWEGEKIPVNFYPEWQVCLLAADDWTPVVLLIPVKGGFTEHDIYNNATVDSYLDRIAADFIAARRHARFAAYWAAKKAREQARQQQASPQIPPAVRRAIIGK